MSGVDNLTPWKPGQTGNPEGGSRKARTKALLRAAFAEIAGKKIPKRLSDRLAELTDAEYEEVKGQLEVLTYAQALATRKWLEAVFGTAGDSARATEQILSTEPKLVELSADLEVEFADEDALIDRILRINSRRDQGEPRKGNGSRPTSGNGSGEGSGV